MLDANDPRYHPKVEPLGRWLLKQTGRTDAIGELAKAAATDRGFPKDGDEAAISKHLNKVQADGEMHMALEDASLEAVIY
ncbi:YozE family protein [Sphingomonas sp. ERG5]|uniref:YozE family protein n=1 Tax=Sphingomonas sp. ERG5 TaxID=1381597 RepID=UPI0006906539|nr:YozE family protein [Sphingomonas sp. ERG5]